MINGQQQGCVWDGQVFCLDCLPLDADKEDIKLIEPSQVWGRVPACIICQYDFDYVAIRMIP